MGNPFAGHTSSVSPTSRGEDERRGGESHGSRDQEHVAKGSHQGGHPKIRPVSEQHFCGSKRGRFVSTYNKPEEIEPLCSLPSLQDGGSQRCEKHLKRGGLDVQVGPEGRILFSSTQSSLSETGPIYVEGGSLRIPMPGFRVEPCPKNFHQVDEGTSHHFKEIGDPSSDIPGRYASDRLIQEGSRDGKGHSNVPFSSSGFNDKPQEVYPRADSTDRVFGDPGGQYCPHILPHQKEKGKTEVTLSEETCFRLHYSEETVLPYRKTEVHCPGGGASTPATPISTTVPDLCSGTKTQLRVRDTYLGGGETGTKMVDQQPGATGGSPLEVSTSGFDNLLRCSQDRRLGSSLTPGVHRGSLVYGGKGPEHQCSGTLSSRIGNKNLHQTPKAKSNSHENRQHIGSILPCEDGGDRKPRNDSHNKTNMELSYPAWDHDYCGMDPVPSKHRSRLGVQERERFCRVEVMSEGFQNNRSVHGTPNSGLIRFQDFPSIGELFQLESGPEMSGGGRFQTGLGRSYTTVRLPSLLPHNESSETGGDAGGGEIDFNRSGVAITTMVSPNTGNGGSTTHPTSRVALSTGKSSRGSSSVVDKLLSKPSGLASVRDSLSQTGVPESACKLILNARREGTSKNYESSWNQWVLWCRRRSVDAFTCPLNDVLGYLASLFDKNLQYRTIGVHRSAISAYHKPIDGVSIGKHPQVSKLMSGVYNLRPPQPKYGFTFHVER